jgi:hypothetical protein
MKLIKTDPEHGVIENYAFQTQKLNEIIEKDWRIVLKQAGVNQDQCVDLYGIDGDTLNSIDFEFYYPSEHIQDPMNIGKKYEVEEISQMLADLEEFSYVRD